MGKVEAEGIVRTVKLTQQQHANTPLDSFLNKPFSIDNVLNLRIECVDKEGNIINVVPVEMRGKQIIGNIEEGDRIKVKGKIEDGIIMTKEVLNITTNSAVKVK